MGRVHQNQGTNLWTRHQNSTQRMNETNNDKNLAKVTKEDERIQIQVGSKTLQQTLRKFRKP